jgi:CRP/FNR family transcriptional regulator, cyclic AMP receptor protein
LRTTALKFRVFGKTSELKSLPPVARSDATTVDTGGLAMRLNLFDYEDPARHVAGDDGVILRGLNEAEWRTLLDFVERQRFPAGAQILRMGEADRTLYILQSGGVDVVIEAPGKSMVIATIGAGSVFGELAFFDGVPRLASIYATGDCELLALSHPAFIRLSAWHPRIARELLFDLGRVLSARLRRAQARS